MNRQDTLYKMKWNPAYPENGNYASDIGWAYKQVNNISNLYGLIDYYILMANARINSTLVVRGSFIICRYINNKD